MRQSLIAVCIALTGVTFGVPLTCVAQRYELRSSVSPRATAARWLRAADPDEALEMSITLRLQHNDTLTALIAAQQDPHSAQYHLWLTPDEFTARFAPSADEYQSVVDWLQSEGFEVRPRVSALRIDFAGTVTRVERTFAVRMNHYSHRGRMPLANENPPQLPLDLIDRVAFVRLNTFALAHPLVRVSASSGLTNTLAPPDMYIAYDVRPLLDASVNGTGQTIAVVARSDFNLSDVSSFQQQFGVPVHNPVKLVPLANPGVGAPNGACLGIRNQRQFQDCVQGEEGEVLLDTEWATAVAPGATVLVDISGTDIDASLLDIVTNHPEATAITISFGACERLDTTDLALFGPLYVQAAAQGQAVLVSTGDSGADDCEDGHGRSVNILSSDPNVTAVGGTSLDPGFDAGGNATGYVSEAVWNDADGASGGGTSTLVSKPAYQDAPGVPAGAFRDQPDVSLVASPTNAGYIMVQEGAVSVAGGTSGGAPSWAGIAALLNHSLRIERFGPLNAMLYTLARNQYAGNGPRVFHDITQGNNSLGRVVGYSAGAGYDLATGLGTPDVAVLAQTLDAIANPPTATPTSTPSAAVTATPSRPSAATATASPAAGACAGDCDGSGSVTIDELLSLVNIALGAGDISSCPAGDTDRSGSITIDEILAALSNAQTGCAG